MKTKHLMIFIGIWMLIMFVVVLLAYAQEVSITPTEITETYGKMQFDEMMRALGTQIP